MSMEYLHLTREGYEKLKEQFEYLKKIRRRELSKQIGQAIAHGDVSDNAEFDAAKEAQALNDKMIAQLENKLTRVQIIDEQNIPKDKALIGATVKLKDLDSKDELQYTLVSEVEADYSQGKISITSPVGQGLLGHKKDEVVEIKTPAGLLRYKILEISRR